jgi:type I restriction enzyme, S subunit
VNDLPASRRWAPLAEIASIQGGVQKQPKRAPRSNRYPFLRVANVTAAGLDLRDVHEIELFGDELERLRLDPGDLLVVEGNGSASQIGRAAVWNGEIVDCVHQNHLIRVRPGPNLLSRYLGLVWNSPAIREELTAIASSTSGLHTLSVAKLKCIMLPLPALSEQRRIVDIVEDYNSHLDAGAAGLRRALARLQVLERRALNDNFSSPGSPMPLSSLIARIETGRSFGGSSSPARAEEWGIIKVSAMTWGEFRPEENKAVAAERVDPRYEIREGDLLLSRANTSEYVGASVLVGPVRPRLLLSDKSLRLIPRPGVRPEWLWRALQAPSARRQISALATGTKESMRNISQASLLQVRVPDLEPAAQERALGQFADVKAASDRLHGEVLEQVKHLSALRRSLLAAAFSGRLVDSEPGLADAEMASA